MNSRTTPNQWEQIPAPKQLKLKNAVRKALLEMHARLDAGDRSDAVALREIANTVRRLDVIFAEISLETSPDPDQVLAKISKLTHDLIDATIEEGQSSTISNDPQVHELDGMLLRPKGGKTRTGGRPQRSREVKEWEKEITYPRFKILIQLLYGMGITKEKFHVYRGKMEKGHMRLVSYHIIDIEPLGKQVYVCNQGGEATFIIFGRPDVNIATEVEKWQLPKATGCSIERIKFQNAGQWEEEIKAALLRTKALKENIYEPDFTAEELIAELKSKYTVAEWFDMSNEQKRELNIKGKKYTAIGGMLGVQIASEKGFNRRIHLAIAEAIFGSDNPELKPYLEQKKDWEKFDELGEDKVKWAKEIKERYTLKEWVTSVYLQRYGTRICGASLKTVAEIFGIVVTNSGITEGVFTKLTHAVWDLKAIPSELMEDMDKARRWSGSFEKYGGDPEKLAKKIKERYSDSQWATMSYIEREKVNIDGIGITAIGSIFGMRISGNPEKEIFLKLGLKIFGEKNEVINVALKELKEFSDKDRLKNTLKDVCTAWEWAKMSSKERSEFGIGGMGLAAIATKLGKKALNPPQNEIHHLELGTVIFDPDDVAKWIQPRLNSLKRGEAMGSNPKLWQAAVREKYSRETWMSFKGLDRRDIEVCGKKLIALQIIFKVPGNANSQNSAYQALTTAIYDT